MVFFGKITFLTVALTPLPTPVRTMTLPSRLHRLESKGLLARPRPNVYVLGTVHIGEKSADEAALLIESVRPRAVIIEVAPSRVAKMRRDNEAGRSPESPPLNPAADPNVALLSLPALVERGFAGGGIGGILFAALILWPSLLKRSFTADEEANTLPRRNEFAAAVKAADTVGARIIAADLEMDELIGSVSRALSFSEWCKLAAVSAEEQLGLRMVDPIRRRRGESITDWADRRRSIDTARASRSHGKESSAAFSRVLVDGRDDRFAENCLVALDSEGEQPVVCVVGLVHLDGVVERLQE
mmetsp:Transcript_1994/g.4326  ORF Transcript_1994/g.4326 Transcript_1994/m.4326 type:complete len:300 (+) Transcript_1994:111-1010(+)